MTELRTFLTSLYDSVSEAEVAALRHGQSRLATLLEEDAVPPDVALPVYHAGDVEVALDVRLEVEDDDSGVAIRMATAEPDDASTLRLTLDLFELVDAGDLASLGYDDLLEAGEDGSGGGAAPPRDRPVTAVHGIGPTYAARLHEQGVETVGDLLALDAETLAETVSGELIDVAEDEVDGWVEAARGLLSVLPEGDSPVELVDGIGPVFGRRLREHGVETLSDLVQRDPGELATAVSTEELTISAQQAAGWLEQARRVLAEAGADEEPPTDDGRPDRTAGEPTDDRPDEEDDR